ncbi:MAG: hypothetical protein KAW41_06185 [Candidatus Diapherotrites archaeon]|nr:hypothetical protein [Candidatus Diapherotrites archaeon]
MSIDTRLEALLVGELRGENKKVQKLCMDWLKKASKKHNIWNGHAEAVMILLGHPLVKTDKENMMKVLLRDTADVDLNFLLNVGPALATQMRPRDVPRALKMGSQLYAKRGSPEHDPDFLRGIRDMARSEGGLVKLENANRIGNHIMSLAPQHEPNMIPYIQSLGQEMPEQLGFIASLQHVKTPSSYLWQHNQLLKTLSRYVVEGRIGAGEMKKLGGRLIDLPPPMALTALATRVLPAVESGSDLKPVLHELGLKREKKRLAEETVAENERFEEAMRSIWRGKQVKREEFVKAVNHVIDHCVKELKIINAEFSGLNFVLAPVAAHEADVRAGQIYSILYGCDLRGLLEKEDVKKFTKRILREVHPGGKHEGLKPVYKKWFPMLSYRLEEGVRADREVYLIPKHPESIKRKKTKRLKK